MAKKQISVAAVLYLLFFGGFAGACEPCTKPPPKAPPVNPFCPKDTLKLGICVNLLGVGNVVVGAPPSSKCCSLLQGLADLEAAICLCTVIKENAAGIKLEWSVALSLLRTSCGKSIPTGFKCA